MPSILFVEDNLQLVEGVVQTALCEFPDAHIEFATDIPTSLALLDRGPFDIVILDAMLPTYADLPLLDEGLHLSAWILNIPTNGYSSVLRSKPRPAWLTTTPPLLVLLSSRGKDGVSATWRALTNGVPEPFYLERLHGDSWSHWNDIYEALQERDQGS